MKRSLLYSIVLGMVLRVSMFAQGWTPQTSPVQAPLGKVKFVSPTEGWISTDNGKLLHTTDTGVTWTYVNSYPADSVNSVSNPDMSLSFVSQSTGWHIGVLGGFENPQGAVIYKTTNGGGSWSRQIVNPYLLGFQVQFIDANIGWASAATSFFPTLNASFLHTTNGGTSWSSGLSLTDNVAFFSFVDANNGWAVVDSITFAISGDLDYIPPFHIIRTTNAGATWTTQHTDNTPGGFEQIQFIDAGNGWVVGDSGKILKTTNGGASWLPVTNTGSTSLSKHRCVFFLDANHGWIGRDDSSGSPVVLHTTNGGTTWTTQNTGVSFAIFSINFVDQNNGWLTTDYGEIYHTTSGGEPTSVRERYESGNPREFRLEQNYPNPFNPATTIRFTVPKSGEVDLKIFNFLGQEIETLVHGDRMAGTYAVEWKPENLPSGVYYYRLRAGNFVENKKLMLVK